METMRFNEMWWVGGHATHEIGGLLWTQAPLSKDRLFLQNNPKFYKANHTIVN